jgi:hypothetical protein
MIRASKKTQLAIDPTTKGFAWVLLEGGDTLVGYGTARVRPPKHDGTLGRITALLERHRPHVLVLEYRDSASYRASRLEVLTRAIEETARGKRIPVCWISRSTVVAVLGPDVRTKYEVACALANRFPELRDRLPRPRKPWMSEDERMNLFDAAGLAVAAALTKRPCGK